MTEKDDMLSKDLYTWILYATHELNMLENEAKVTWHIVHDVGKFLICESREDASTRLFIRNVTNEFDDSNKKEGWWNTFTVTDDPTHKGLWLARAIEYRLDKNGFLNLKVKPILQINDVSFRTLFSFESKDGTWESSAWWLMMGQSDAFLSEYEFHWYGCIHNPNIDELTKKFPELKGYDLKVIGKIILNKFLKRKVTIKEIEECLNKPCDWEVLIEDVFEAVARGNTKEIYGEKYPLFANKIMHNVGRNLFGCYISDVENYIRRQMDYYDEILREGKIDPIKGGVLDIVER